MRKVSWRGTSPNAEGTRGSSSRWGIKTQPHYSDGMHQNTILGKTPLFIAKYSMESKMLGQTVLSGGSVTVPVKVINYTKAKIRGSCFCTV